MLFGNCSVAECAVTVVLAHRVLVRAHVGMLTTLSVTLATSNGIRVSPVLCVGVPTVQLPTERWFSAINAKGRHCSLFSYYFEVEVVSIFYQ